MTTTQLPRSAYAPVRKSDPRPSLRRVARESVIGVVAGAAVLFAYGAAAVAVHGPMAVGDPGDTVPITAASFAIGVLFSSFFGVVIAVALARWAKRPARTFQRAAIVLAAGSLYAPFTAHTDTATKYVLAVGHVVAAAVIVPLIVRALRTRNV
jgi:peptidoglycan/LPS O-acetylase OafA/YrhL